MFAAINSSSGSGKEAKAMSKNTLYPGQGIVWDLYYTHHLSCAKIAALAGVSPRSVMRWLKKAGVIPRKNWDRAQTVRMSPELAKSLRMDPTPEEAVTCFQ